MEREEPPLMHNSPGRSLENTRPDSKQSNLHTWTGLLKYESIFFLIIFLELFWLRADTIIASLYFTQVEVATQSALMNSVMFMDCFCYGFGISTASGISKYIVQLKVRLSKKFAIAATMVSIIFGTGFALLLYNFSENIAVFLINDVEVQVKLTYMQRFYCGLVPLQLCQGVIYAVVRSIGMQSRMIYFQIIANYFVHFSVYFG